MLCPNKGHHIFYFVLSGCLPSHEERPLHLFEKDNNSALSDVGMIARNQAMTSSNLVLLEEKDNLEEPKRTERWCFSFLIGSKNTFLFLFVAVSLISSSHQHGRNGLNVLFRLSMDTQSLNLHIRK